MRLLRKRRIAPRVPPRRLFDCGTEMRFRCVLKSRADVADALRVTKIPQAPLDRGEGVDDEADEHVLAALVRPRAFGSPSELLLVEPHHRSRYLGSRRLLHPSVLLLGLSHRGSSLSLEDVAGRRAAGLSASRDDTPFKGGGLAIACAPRRAVGAGTRGPDEAAWQHLSPIQTSKRPPPHPHCRHPRRSAGEAPCLAQHGAPCTG